MRYQGFKILAIVSTLVIFSNCRQKQEQPTEIVEDTLHTIYKDTLNYPIDKKPFGDKFRSAKIIALEEQIDTTYYILANLTELKKELSQQATFSTVAARNKKSKALYSINQIENELMKETDVAILQSLKKHTEQLAVITKEMENDGEHLQKVCARMQMITNSLTMLTKMMSLGVGSGWFKPATPASSTVQDVKASLQ